jgi:hypothetical protein
MQQHDAFSASGEGEFRPSLDIELCAHYGDVSLSLPRCFRGLITVREDITLSPALEEHAALLSDVQGMRVYFVGDRPRSWMSWGDDDDKEGEEAAAGTGRDPEEPLDKLFASGWNSALQIYWDGEPGFPR